MRKYIVYWMGFLIMVMLALGIAPFGRYGYVKGTVLTAEAKQLSKNKLPKNFPKKIKGLTYNGDAYSYKGYIYCTYISNVNQYGYGTEDSQAYIYRMKSNGTKLKKIKKIGVKGYPFIYLVAGNIIYMGSGWHDNPSGLAKYDKPSGWFDSKSGYQSYQYNMKTKKETFYKKQLSYAEKINKNHYAAYIYNQSEGSEIGLGRAVINTKTGKIIFLSGFDEIVIVGKKYIYLKNKGMTSDGYYLCSCNLSGKNKKKLVRLKSEIAGGYWCPWELKVKGKKIYLNSSGLDTDYVYSLSDKKLREL